jgi:hypothetical protein
MEILYGVRVWCMGTRTLTMNEIAEEGRPPPPPVLEKGNDRQGEYTEVERPLELFASRGVHCFFGPKVLITRSGGW